MCLFFQIDSVSCYATFAGCLFDDCGSVFFEHVCLGTVSLCLNSCIHQSAGLLLYYKVFSDLSVLGFSVAEPRIHGCFHILNTAGESSLHQIASLKSVGERSMRMKCRKEDFHSLYHT